MDKNRSLVSPFSFFAYSVRARVVRPTLVFQSLTLFISLFLDGDVLSSRSISILEQ